MRFLNISLSEHHFCFLFPFTALYQVLPQQSGFYLMCIFTRTPCVHTHTHISSSLAPLSISLLDVSFHQSTPSNNQSSYMSTILPLFFFLSLLDNRYSLVKILSFFSLYAVIYKIIYIAGTIPK